MNTTRPRRAFAAQALLVAAGLAAPELAEAVTCTASATPVAFGTYNPFDATPNTTTGSITVTCQPVLVALLLSYTVDLSAGGAGSFAPRNLSAGAHTLNYQLYTDAARSIVWGDGSGGTSSVSGGFLLSVLFPVSATHTVYGRIPALQSGTWAGSYADTIVVTVTY